MTATLDFPRFGGLEPFPIAPFGFETGGYGTEGDVVPRVIETADGVDLNRVWDEFDQTLREWNQRAADLAGLLSYWHTNAADPIPRSFNQHLFERASEFGEPVSIRPGGYELVGYDFEDYDAATRFTWKFLRDADARQVRAAHNEALSADSRLVTSTILRRLFDPVQGTNDQGTPVYGLYNGDGMVPAPFAGQSFDGDHTHYVVSGNLAIDSGDVEGAIRLVREHGFGLPESGQQLLLLCHPNQAEAVMSWKKNAENENTAVAKYDALPSTGSPAFVSEGPIVGRQAPADYAGVPVSGSYGPALVIESYFVPNNYFAVVATSGSNSANNAIGVREHPNAVYRGLRQIPGPVPHYPLQESFYTRGFGVGTRWRGAAAVCQITDAGTYTPPNVMV
ncbi:hypothetical protein BST23_25330 [Mycolicibacterium elephantis]|uniref:Bacteriophage protein n=1 Tax=Mycolicibacterium elephantis TaxID=81858 RepID=A0A1X0CF09_9MYCO|nr:hypothetical protein [Mycolicibacterium elephantis]ORA58704.1 hypothetical protein BST23_25330 [Mycolicibacterium elephantis]